MTPAQDIDRARRPDRPLAEQPAGKVERRAAAIRGERREQIGHDRIIVSRVKRHVVAAALRECGGDVERPVAIERCDFYGDDAVDVEEATPEGAVENTSADGGLQV